MKAGTRFAATVTLVLALSMAAVTVPAAAGQEPGPGARAGRRGADPDRVRQRQQALRQRQEGLRRARLAARRGPAVTEVFSQSVKIGRSGAFSLESASGSITITGGGGEDVRIEATKRVWQPTDADARTLLSEVDIEVIERAGAVSVRTVLPNRSGLSIEVDYTVAVPSGASVSVRTVAGDIRVNNVQGELRVDGASSAITVASAGQVRSLRTVSGTIQLDNVQSDDLVASSLGGSMSLRGIKARGADLRAMSGDVIIVDGEIERATVQSFSGRVEFSGKLARTGRYALQSRTGDVRFAPTAGDFDLEATTVAGTVRSDVAVTLDERRAARMPRRVPGARGGGARVMRGVAGQGGALVTLRTFSGSIVITRSNQR